MLDAGGNQPFREYRGDVPGVNLHERGVMCYRFGPSKYNAIQA